MSIFRPDIKPPMWGPPEAIQYAARANAERLGIDYSRILLLIPSWENGGLPFDVISARPPLSGSMGWKDGNAVFTPSQSFATYANPMSGVPTALSGFCRFMHTNPTFANIERLIATRHEINNTGWSFSAGRASGLSPNRKQGLVFTIFGVADYVFPSDTLNAPSETVFTDNGFSWAGNQLRFYFGGDLKQTTTTGNMTAGSPFIHQNKVRNSDATPGPTTGQQAICIAARELWPQSVFAQLAATPYALLMPVSRPVYFDMGGGGGYTYQFTSAPTTTTSVSNVVASVLKELSTEAATTTSTNTTIVNLLKDLIVAASSVTNTSQPVYNINRDFYIESNSTVNTNNIALLISGFIELIVSSVTNTNTSGVTINTLKELLSSATVTTTTNNIAVFIETLIELIASSAIQTNTSSTFLATKRELSVSSISAAQVQNVVINVIREFISLAQSGASTSEIQVFISSLLEFIVNSTINTETTDVAINIVKELTTDVVSGVSLSVALATVDRKISATTNSQSTTAAMHLVLSGIAAITDTLIFSKTINRNIYSKTVNRIITQV